MIRLKTIKSYISALVVMSLTVGLYGLAQAFEFRGMKPIGPPVLQGTPGARPAPEMQIDLKPIPRDAINKAVQDFFTAWNNGTVDMMLAPEFVNKDKLLDAIVDTVPRDAKIRVLSIQSTATLPGDVIEELPDGSGFNRLAIVTATVETQIEFTDSNGFQTIKGVSDYLFKVKEEYR